MSLRVLLFILLFWTPKQASSIACYECEYDARNPAVCSENPVANETLTRICSTDISLCRLSYTSATDTLEKLGFKRRCITNTDLLEIAKFGPQGTVHKKVNDIDSSLLRLVIETYFTCNTSLCNRGFPNQPKRLSCYVCTSLSSSACDYEGTALLSMNNSFLSSCPGSYLCAASYDLQPNGTVVSVDVTRSCISKDDARLQKLKPGQHHVVVENSNSDVKTHIYVCDTSGCNVAFPEEFKPISCYVCNDAVDSKCDFEGMELPSTLLRSCSSSTELYYCSMWYKVDLRTKQRYNVVRSCVSKAEALRYKRMYGGKSVSGLLAKVDSQGKASYHMHLCGSIGCNAKFPAYKPEDMRCYLCSQGIDQNCSLDGDNLREEDLKVCDSPDDICSMSYRVRVDTVSSQKPFSATRNCISKQKADLFMTTYGDINNIVVFRDKDMTGFEVYVFFCYFPRCNNRFPVEQNSVLPFTSSVRCYECPRKDGSDCPYEMTGADVREFISGCPKGDEYRCFMSYDVNSTNKHYNIVRKCVWAAEILQLKSLYGRKLVARTGEGSNAVETRMFHCAHSLCNRDFPLSSRPAIGCFACSLETDVDCDVDGLRLHRQNASVYARCPSYEAYVCGISVGVDRNNASDVVWVVRRCIPAVQADFYTSTYGESALLSDDNNLVHLMSFCNNSACNQFFPHFQDLLKRSFTRFEANRGPESGKLIDRSNNSNGNTYSRQRMSSGNKVTWIEKYGWSIIEISGWINVLMMVCVNPLQTVRILLP